MLVGQEARGSTLGDLLADTAARRGDAAVLADHTTATRGAVGDAPSIAREQTFEELDRQVNSLAQGLIEAGLGRGERIGAVLPNCAELLALWFAVARAGGVLVPLDPRLTCHERDGLLRHAGVSLLVASPGHLSEHSDLPRLRTRVSVGGGLAGAESIEALTATDGARPGVRVASRDPLAVLYTSGTSGRPKGCVLAHDSFVVPARSFRDRLQVTPADRCLVCLPLFHMAGQSFVTAAVAGGATIALVDRFRASHFWAQVLETRATLVRHLGEMLALLIQRERQPEDRRHALRAVYGGGAVRPVASTFERRFGVPVVEGYGLTETNTVLCNELANNRHGSIGRALPHCEVRIVDEDGIARADGEVGEIQVRRNPVVMREYLEDPELTAETFAGEWLRTGDLGRRDADGHFSFEGRTKDVIRRRGEMISAPEVEEVLNRHPAVATSAVVPSPGAHGSEEVKAFVAPASGATASAAELTAWCRRFLAEFKVPTLVELSDSLPRTSTNKVNKAMLRAGGAGDDAGHDAPGRSRKPKAVASQRDEPWQAVTRLAAVVRRRAREIEDSAVELLGVSRRVARADISLTLRRLDALPDLRSLLEDRVPVGKVALALPGNAILSNPVATVLCATVAGNEVRARLPRRRRAWMELLGELLDAAALPATELVEGDGPSFLAESLADPEVAVVMVFGADAWAAPYENDARRTGTTFIFEGPGKDPFLVLAPVAVETAAVDAVHAAFHNAGQACTSPERFYVLRDAHDRFVARAAELATVLAVGEPRDERTEVGPVDSPERARHVRGHIVDAIARGAEAVCGETATDPAHHDGSNTLVLPTVLAGVDHRAAVVREETFGPVIPVIEVSSAREAIELAEDSVYGLSANVYGGPEWVSRRLARSHGTVFVDETWLGRRRRQPLAPYGGRKRSGWVWESHGETFVRRDGPRNNLLEFSAPRPLASSR
ncbi:MAG: aldehyde dehydrogenase family protein [Solirubrobacteraceae bacterium MAG38_C4-C5]|nr:aldehyde dehydrogenase family protein [Candidatus Siliceabacter maunaloa]